MKKIINAVMFFSFLAAFSSCLKDDTIIGPDSPGAINAVVEFKNPATISSNTSSSVPVYLIGSDRVAEKVVEMQVNYTGNGGAPNDIHVKIAVDNKIGLKAIAEQEETYDVASPDLYKISATDLVIPKGKKTASFTVTYYPEKFNRVFYALGLSIESVTGTTAPISGNFGKIAVFLGTKNKWEGTYLYNGVTSLGNSSDEEAYLTTSGDYSVSMYLINYYSNQVVFTVDPVTNKVTVSMTTLLPIATDPSSHWDPATETFHVKWTSNGGARKYDETYEKID